MTLDPFTQATADAFTDPVLSTTGTYTPVSGPAVTDCPALLWRVDRRVAVGTPGARRPGWELLLPTSHVADEPARGATFTAIDGRACRVQSAGPDSLRLAWRCDCDDA